MSPRSAYLQKAEELGFNPERISFDYNSTDLAIQNFGLGDDRMEAFAAAMSHFPYEYVNIRNNRMTHRGLKHVCENLSDGCFQLDVGENNIGTLVSAAAQLGFELQT